MRLAVLGRGAVEPSGLVQIDSGFRDAGRREGRRTRASRARKSRCAPGWRAGARRSPSRWARIQGMVALTLSICNSRRHVVPGADGQVGLVAVRDEALIIAQQFVEHEVVPAGDEVVGRGRPRHARALVERRPEVVVVDGLAEPAPPERHLVADDAHVAIDQRQQRRRP